MLKFASVVFLSLFAAIALLIVFNPGFAAAGNDAPARTMTVSGNGAASGKPDIATINLGVLSEAKTASEALEENNQKMATLLTSLKQAGIEEKDIQTSQFNVSPRYTRYKNELGQSENRISGYRVSNQVHVIVRELDGFGAILDTVIADGANTMNGISFGFSNPDPMVDAARVNAIKEARRKAELYAQTAGVSLGKILTFQEQYGSTPRPVHARAMVEDMKAVPIAVGESEITAGVTITWELE